MNQAQLINQTSGDVEYYTPPNIISAARAVLGWIDLDPASSAIANDRIGAKEFFSANGLAQSWYGRVWMNHPFRRGENAQWVNKLVREVTEGHVIEALCITYACTSEAWFQPLLERPICFLSPRTNYYLPNGSIKKGVTKGSAVTYFGNDVARFARHFHLFGQIKVTL